MRYRSLLLAAGVLVAARGSTAQVPTLVGSEFRVNTYTTQRQNVPRVGRSSNGDFVVVWESFRQFGTPASYDIFGQRYSSSGVPKGGEFLVNSYTTSVQRDPSLAVLSNGDFIVVWGGVDSTGSGIFFKRFSSTGAPIGSDSRFGSHPS